MKPRPYSSSYPKPRKRLSIRESNLLEQKRLAKKKKRIKPCNNC